MLGEGVSAGFEYLGVNARTVCYVEREAPAAAQLVALMEAGALAPAAIWSDMLTFDGRSWRSRVDGIVAGFPCQDLSIAGRRAGLDGKRSGLFFRVLDIADDSGAWLLVLENVSGIASATASVVDEAEGDLEERAAARVLGELADRGGMRNGSLFQRPMLAPVTSETDGFASLGAWPTPKASEHQSDRMGDEAMAREIARPGAQRSVSGVARFWTTPDVCSGARDMSKIDPEAAMWLTPNVPNGGRSVSAELVASKGMTEDGEKKTVGLESQTKHWGTPQARDYRSPDSPDSPNYQRKLREGYTIDLNSQAAAWPTPRATDGTKGGPNQAGSKGDLMLPSAAAQFRVNSAGMNSLNTSDATDAPIAKVKDSILPVLAWPTPAARDAKGANSSDHVTTNGTGRMHMDQLPNFVQHHFLHPDHPTQSGAAFSAPVVSVHGKELSPTTRPEHVLGRLRLNPAFACWLMGWPSWWTNPGITSSVRSEMALYRSKLLTQLSYLLCEQAS